MDVNSDLILASHLYEHVPASFLSYEDFVEQYDKNAQFIGAFRKFSKDFFAFPHGAEGKDFNDLHLNFLKNNHNVSYVFSADSGFNTFNTLKKKSIRRIHITHEFATDVGIIYLLFRGIFLNSRKK
jgi:hypothetical protein